MTSKERMLAAYRREPVDRPPISPEIWSTTVLEFTGKPFHKCYGPFAQEDYTGLWLKTQKHFGFDAWLISDLTKPPQGNNYKEVSDSYFINDDTVETKRKICTTGGELEWITRTNSDYDGWGFYNPVRDFKRDINAYAAYTLDDPSLYDSSKLEKDLITVGDDGLVSTYIGNLFISWLADGRAGSIGAALIDIMEYPEDIPDLHTRYIEYAKQKIRRFAQIDGVDNVMVINGYSDAGVIGPSLYKEWELPFLKAVASEAHLHGLSVHLHQHGKCRNVLGMIAESGIDLVDCLERPSANGDIENISEIAALYGKQISLKGNMDPINVLRNGNKQDIEAQIEEIAKTALKSPGFIISTGDSVVEGTDLKNLEFYYDCAVKYIC